MAARVAAGLGPMSTPPPLARKPLPHNLRPKDAPIRPVSFSGSRPREGAATPRRKTRSPSGSGRCPEKGCCYMGPTPRRCEDAPTDHPLPHTHRAGTSVLRRSALPRHARGGDRDRPLPAAAAVLRADGQPPRRLPHHREALPRHARDAARLQPAPVHDNEPPDRAHETLHHECVYYTPHEFDLLPP